MMLVDEGKVNLDEPVENYLPEFKGQWLAVLKDGEHVLLQQPKRPFTVKEMLNHTSGLTYPRFQSKFDAYSLRECVIAYALTPLNYEPGTRYEYTNAGPNSIGRPHRSDQRPDVRGVHGSTSVTPARHARHHPLAGPRGSLPAARQDL